MNENERQKAMRDVQNAVEELLDDFCAMDYATNTYVDEDGSPVFELSQKYPDGSRLDVTYSIPRQTIEDRFSRERLRIYYQFENFLRQHDPNLAEDDSEEFLDNEWGRCKAVESLRYDFLHSTFDKLFRLAAKRLPSLAHAQYTTFIINRTLSQLKKLLPQIEGLGGFDLPPQISKQDLRAAFTKSLGHLGKDFFKESVDILCKDLPPKERLFNLFYEKYYPLWKEAQQTYKDKKHKDTWAKTIFVEFNEELPMDLIANLASLDPDEREPAKIAKIHAARLCDYPVRTAKQLSRINDASKRWLETAAPELVVEMLDAYQLPLSFDPGVIDREENTM